MKFLREDARFIPFSLSNTPKNEGNNHSFYKIEVKY